MAYTYDKMNRNVSGFYCPLFYIDFSYLRHSISNNLVRSYHQNELCLTQLNRHHFFV